MTNFDKDYRAGSKEGKQLAKLLHQQLRDKLKELRKEGKNRDFLEGVRDAVNDKTLTW
jgi:hypothetical protein